MTIIDKFYRQGEIIEIVQYWEDPLIVSINHDKKVVEVELRSGIGEKLKPNEISDILAEIHAELEPTCDENGKVTIGLKKALHARLKELRDQIRKDFDLEKGVKKK
ncbi:unnamed protein product [marine sediment metagenome]|uniref:Uncharacterized protein n=1 Tax=marine sediment metagenome TaxID=412755 RepID=X0UKS4_9ZZZZ